MSLSYRAFLILQAASTSSVLQAASNSIFSLLRVEAFGAYSYVQHRSEFVVKHVEQTSAAQPA